MSRETIVIAKLATTTPNKFLRISVSYTKGGMSYMSGTYKNRGYSLHVTPIEDKGDGGWSTILMSGCGHFFEPAARFNRARLEALAAQGDKLPKYKECVDRVLLEESLVLEVKESVPA